MLIMKLKLAKEGSSIRATIFFGEEGFTFQNSGSLVMRMGEYQLLGACLLAGEKQMTQHFKTIVENEEEVFKLFGKKEN